MCITLGSCFIMCYSVSFFCSAITLLRKRESAVADGALCLFLAAPWGGLQSMVMAFPSHSRLLFDDYLG